MNPIPELSGQLKQLRLSGILDSLEARNREAVQGKLAYTDFLAMLIGGVLVVEYIFDYPGLGHLTVLSVVARDFPLIQGIAILTSAVFVFINILVDLITYAIDPRVEL